MTYGQMVARLLELEQRVAQLELEARQQGEAIIAIDTSLHATLPLPDLPDLATLRLQSGGHQRRENGVCIMEAVAWRAGERHSDHPRCASWAIASIMRRLNDWMTAEERQQLVPYVDRLVGSATSHETEIRRALLAADWGLREKLPEALDLLELPAQAARLRALPKLESLPILEAAAPAISSAARAAAGDALDARDARDARDPDAYARARAEHIRSALALVARMLDIKDVAPVG